MIKLNRGECPKELTDEVKEELTELYKKDKEKDVWNSPKIKKTLKETWNRYWILSGQYS